ADRVDESHFGLRMSVANKIDNLSDEIDRLGCLRNDSVTRADWKMRNIFRRTQNDCARKIPDQPFHLDMAGFANHDRKEPGRDELLELLVRVTHEWTSSICDLESSRPPLRAFHIGRAMRRDHDTSRCRFCRAERSLADALCAQPLPDNGVVHEFAEDGERTFGGELFRLDNRIAHSETHPEMFSQNDSHSCARLLTLWHKVRD